MSFLLIAAISLAILGILAALFSGNDNEPVITDDDGKCSSCTSRGDCQLAEMAKRREKKGEEREKCLTTTGVVIALLLLAGCSTKKNTSQTRFWHSFTARYNTYYNGSQAFIDGSIEKENGNHDNCTELIPLYPVSNKQSRDLGKSNYSRAIEKAEKTIKQHSIKARPEWNKSRRKTAKDLEWLGRREYNPFLWHAWLLLGKSQFQQGLFEEAASTFSYMSRLYQTQPAINGIARAWQAKSYVELDWIYDAEDVIQKQQRDTMHYRAVKDWDYTYADYYIRSRQYKEAIPYLRKVIGHERRRKQKAREWFLMGQLQTILGHPAEAYNAYKHVIRLNPPYELEFNARIAQTEVMPSTDPKRKISKLRRMARSDNNKDYLDQVYYAIGNVWLSQRDTTQAVEAYEKGVKESARNGIEKGVLLLTLGNVYWSSERYADAQRCYGEAIGLLDKERPDYKELSERSKILDELAPHTSAVELQDSLQRLANMPEEQRLKIIDNIIKELKEKEEEERRLQEEAETEKALAKQSAVGNRQQQNTPQRTVTPSAMGGNQQWYFYNPQAVNQGKQTFQRQWGKRENQDDWQRMNKTVVSTGNTEDTEHTEDSEATENNDDTEGTGQSNSNTPADSLTVGKSEAADTLANDPHNREYYLAQIPFTDDQVAASNALIMDGLFHSGIIFKDKLNNLTLGERALSRLTSQYPEYEHNDEAWYHLFLLHSRRGDTGRAEQCIDTLKQYFPESEWTLLLSDPNFAENQRFGVHIEDSVYAATYDAFKANQTDIVRANTYLSATRFPLGQHRPKFLFIEGLSLLNVGEADSCMARLKMVVEKYPQSEVSELAGMIIRGVQQGRQLYGGKFDIGDVWSLRDAATAGTDSLHRDTLTVERNSSHVFLLAYQPDSVSQNQLLYELARYNFSNFLVRNFEINIDQDAHGMTRMLVSGFLSYDEAMQYARQLMTTKDKSISQLLRHCRSLVVSERNLPLLGTAYSYADYEVFFLEQIAPMEVSERPLLDEPETIIQETDEDETPADAQDPQQDPALPSQLQQPQNSLQEFDEDFWY